MRTRDSKTPLELPLQLPNIPCQPCRQDRSARCAACYSRPHPCPAKQPNLPCIYRHRRVSFRHSVVAHTKTAMHGNIATATCFSALFSDLQVTTAQHTPRSLPAPLDGQFNQTASSQLHHYIHSPLNTMQERARDRCQSVNASGRRKGPAH